MVIYMSISSKESKVWTLLHYSSRSKMRDVKFMSIVKMTKCFSIIGHYVYNISLMAYLNVTEKKKKEGEN